MADYRSTTGIGVVGVVSTGYVGAGWVAFFLSRGLRVSVWGRRPEAGAELEREIAEMWPDLERLGLWPGADRHALQYGTDLAEMVAGCDFVQENAAEDPALKEELYARIDAETPPDVLIASSTSSLPVTGLQARCKAPGRCVLGHPFTPTHLMRLVEVVGGAETDPSAVDAAMATYAFWGKRPVRLEREIFGHIANRLASALWREAVHLVATGVASVADVDTALVEGLGRKWAITGPFQSYHLSGGHGGFDRFIDSYGTGIQRRWDDLGTSSLDPAMRALLKQKVAEAFEGRTAEQMAADRARHLVNVHHILRDDVETNRP